MIKRIMRYIGCSCPCSKCNTLTNCCLNLSTHCTVDVMLDEGCCSTVYAHHLRRMQR